MYPPDHVRRPAFPCATTLEGTASIMTTSKIIERESYDITVTNADDLVATMRHQNERIKQRQASDAGTVWWLYQRDGTRTDLIAGVRGERGCLVWCESQQLLHPQQGMNAEFVDYFTWGNHAFTQPPGVEVPIADLYRAVEEYATTGGRPTCVEWVPAPDSERTGGQR